MIVFGYKTKPVSSEQLLGVCCQSCGKDLVHRFITWTYFHLYWIPVFPYKKGIFTSCQNCKQSYRDKEVPEQLRNAMGSQVQKISSPAYMFAGLLIIACLGGYGVYQSGESHKQTVALAAEPHAQDLYVVQLKQLEGAPFSGVDYAIFKVANVEAGTVRLKVPNVGYSKASGVSKALSDGLPQKDNYYTKDTFDVEHAKLKVLAEHGGVDRIIRLN